MAELDLTNIAATSIATPASGVSAIFVDTADLYVKQRDSSGTLNVLNSRGLQDRNILANGGFQIQQRVATASTAIPSVSTTTRAGQVADRWAVTVGSVTTPSWAQIDTNGAFETGLTSRFYGKITQATNAAKFVLSQWMIAADISAIRGSKVRLSCKIKQFAGSNAVYRLGLLQLTSAGTVDTSPSPFLSAIGAASVEPIWGTNLAAITPDASPIENGTVSGVALSITSTTAWVRSSCVFTLPTDCKNLVVVIYRDTLGGANDACGFAEVQLTQSANLVDYVEMPLIQDLLRCQRFFQKSFPLTTVPASSLATNGATMGIIGKATAVALAAKLFPVFSPQMWKTPTTLTLFTPTAAGAVPFRIDGTTPAAQTAVAQSLLSDRGAFISATGDLNGAVGDMVAVHWTAEADFIS